MKASRHPSETTHSYPALLLFLSRRTEPEHNTNLGILQNARFLVFGDICRPKLGLLFDEPPHKCDAVRVIRNQDLDASFAEESFVAAEGRVFGDNHTGDAELDDSAGAHHARREGRVERHLAMLYITV